MRPWIVMWLEHHGVPGALAPGYAAMVGLGAWLAGVLVLRLARRDGADLPVQVRAVFLAYVAALAGGYVFEGLRNLPAAWAAGSLAPIATVGRAAYGGLLAGLLAPVLYLRAMRGEGPSSVRAFLDRATVVLGVSFAFVRVGCWLEGCDYGRPTAGMWGVRFPPGSPAAADHLARGWVPAGAASLPVHPTQLYEAALGVAASLIALRLLRSRPRDGGAFVAWMTTYAVGRFAIELLRGDAERGIYLGLSTAQYVSLGLLAVLALFVLRGRGSQAGGRRHVRSAPLSAAALLLVLLAASPRPALAQTQQGQPGNDVIVLKSGESLRGSIIELRPGDHATLQLASGQTATVEWQYIGRIDRAGVTVVPSAPPAPAPAPAPVAPPPAASAAPAAPPRDDFAWYKSQQQQEEESEQDDRHVTLRAAAIASLTMTPGAVPMGGAVELDAMYRFRAGRRSRIELGLEGRYLGNSTAAHWTLGVPVEFVAEGSKIFEVTFTAVLTETWIVFRSPFFPQNGANLGGRFALGFQFSLGGRLLLGLSPFALNIIGDSASNPIVAYEPRLWLGCAL